MRYKLQKSEDPGFWVLTDTDTGLVCKFRDKAFNEDQKFTFLDDLKKEEMLKAPQYAAEMADWLRENCPEIALDLTFRQEIGIKIKRRRKEKGLSIRQLADAAGMSKNNVERIEGGIYNYTIDNLKAILDALDLELKIDDISE